MKRLSYANVMSTMAFFLALGGVSYAAVSIPANSVGTRQIVDKSVGTNDLADKAVTSSKINPAVLTMFKGQKGEKGVQGLQGPQGDAGDRGPQGSQGLQGQKGDSGLSSFPLKLVTVSLHVSSYEQAKELQSGSYIWFPKISNLTVSGSEVLRTDENYDLGPMRYIVLDEPASDCQTSVPVDTSNTLFPRNSDASSQLYPRLSTDGQIGIAMSGIESTVEPTTSTYEPYQLQLGDLFVRMICVAN